VLLLLCGTGIAQTECWVYTHQEPTPRNDAYAFLVCVGRDGNVYAAGSEFGLHLEDFVVISLTPDSGLERWHYVHDPLGDADMADAGMLYAPDGNLYVAGVHSIHGVCNLALVSLDTLGSERWAYEYNGPGDGGDWAGSAPVWGGDGKLYVCGVVHDTGQSNGGALAIGITSAGQERWAVNGYDLQYTSDCFNDMALGADGNVYACGLAGNRTGLGSGLLIASLEPDSGQIRWVHVHDGTGSGYDQANSLVCGPDSSIYVCGYENGTIIGGNRDLIVLCLTPRDSLRWVYRYAGPAGGRDSGTRIRIGPDGNLYITGYSSNGTDLDGLAVSLTAAGDERWVYRYNSGPGDDDFTSFAFDSSGRVLACGVMGDAGSGSGWLSAVCLTADGQLVWDYAYQQALGIAYDIACGNDGLLYVAGPTLASNDWVAFTVVCLESRAGLKDRVISTRTQAGPIPTVARGVLFLPQAGMTNRRVPMTMSDISGRKVMELAPGENDIRHLSPGVYFVTPHPNPLPQGERGREPAVRKVVVQR
jgi:hypothetical protein